MQVKCGVPWCIGLVVISGRQYCIVHEDAKARTANPPPVQRELEQRYVAERAARQ